MVSYPSLIKSFAAKIFSLALLCLLSFPLASCGLRQQMIADGGVSTDTTTSFTDGDHQDGQVSAFADIEITTSGRSYPFKAALALKRPCYLRMELLPVIGVPDFVLAASPEKMNILIPSRGELYSGQPTADHLKKFLPWPMAIEDLVMILTGASPSLPEKNIAYREFREDSVLHLEMKAPSGLSQIIRMNNNKPVKMIRKDEAGRELYSVQYFYVDPNGDLPQQIIITLNDGTASLSVTYSDVKIEKPADLSIFHLDIPAGIKEIPLE